MSNSDTVTFRLSIRFHCLYAFRRVRVVKCKPEVDLVGSGKEMVLGEYHKR